jgi:hypothetical protein
LRSEIAERVATAAGGYKRDLADAVEEAVTAIQRAIERARSERQRGEHGASERLARLAEIAQRCDRLGDEFWALSGAPAGPPTRREAANLP